MDERESATTEGGLALGKVIRHPCFCVLPQVDVNGWGSALLRWRAPPPDLITGWQGSVPFLTGRANTQRG
uniref:hypothetical protein n=1 Tax=Methylobacterium sp. B34 TaxID=95563 RepID=UPI0019552795